MRVTEGQADGIVTMKATIGIDVQPTTQPCPCRLVLFTSIPIMFLLYNIRCACAQPFILQRPLPLDRQFLRYRIVNQAMTSTQPRVCIRSTGLHIAIV